jgi:hypothetical protein
MSVSVDVELVAAHEATPERLDDVVAPFVCLHLPGVVVGPGAAAALARFLIDHPDYAAAGPRMTNAHGNVITTWAEAGDDGLLARLDKRLKRLASAPLASRDARVLSCAALVVDTEELIATLEDARVSTDAHPLCWRLAQRFGEDDRRLRWCGDIEVPWGTHAAAAADLDAGPT